MSRSTLSLTLFVLLTTTLALAESKPPDTSGDVPPASAPLADPDGGPSTYPDGGPILPGLVAPPLTPEEEKKQKKSLIPTPKEAPPSPTGKIRLEADPVGDGAILSVSLGFGLLSELILTTGEIRPQQISDTFNTNSLIALDRIAITQKISGTAGSYSNYGLYVASAFAIIDPILTGIREDSRQAALVDGVIYAEAVGVTYAATNLAKVTVRRPRPYAYVEFNKHKDDPVPYNNADTDSSLSFFSGHTATVAAISSAATYLAFARAGDGPRPWVTLIAGTAVTSFVAIERVRAGQHFPTDVLAGVMAGGGIGLLVAHMHREDTAKQRPVWIGFTPLDTSGGMATLGGEF